MALQVIRKHRITCDNVQELKVTIALRDLAQEVIL